MGMTPKPREGDQFRAALNTRPNPLNTMGPKGVPAQSKKRRQTPAHG
jgi:hypothetical protein